MEYIHFIQDAYSTVFDIHFRGGGAKDYVPARTYASAEPNSTFGRGPAYRGCFNALSVLSEPYSLSTLKEFGWKTPVDPILGGRLLHHPPPGSATGIHCFYWLWSYVAMEVLTDSKII